MPEFAFYSTDIDPTTDPANADPAPETLVVLDQVPILGNAAYNLMAGEIGRGAVIQTGGDVVIQDFGVMDGDQRISFSDTDALSAETLADLKTIHETVDGEYFFTDGYDIWRVRFARRGGFRYRRNLFWAQHNQEIYGYEINLIVMASLRREIADFGLSLETVEGLWKIADCKLPLQAAAWLTEDSKFSLEAVEGGFTPSGTPAAWWPADRITGLEDDDPVGTFPDHSGNGNDLVQATAANKPLYKVNIQNGLPAVQSDGIGMYMTCATIATAQTNTVFLVGSLVSMTINSMLYDGITTRQLYYTGAGTFQSYAGVLFNSLVNIDTNAHVHVNLFKGAASSVRIDTAETVGNAGTGAIDGLIIFTRNNHSSQFLDLNLMDMIFYYSEEDPTANESGFNTKYAVY